MARALAADPPLLLMDEPFGAIDPIARVRIQDEFLELQRRIGKTVLFVTHDIDEAIRLGDRVAMLRVGGRVAQYASPQQLLMRPADDFVADFVGADRALKRLSLMAAAEIDLEPVPDGAGDLLRVEARTSVRTALSEMLEADTEDALVVRGRRRAARPAERRRDRPPARGRADRGARDPVSAGGAWILVAQSSGGFFRDRSHDDCCVANNGFCPRWTWDHFDRYVHPFWQHL